MPHTEIRQNANGEWALFMRGWDTNANGDGHSLNDCREMIDELVQTVSTLATNKEYNSTPSLFEDAGE